jgi:hypothetical protein
VARVDTAWAVVPVLEPPGLGNIPAANAQPIDGDERGRKTNHGLDDYIIGLVQKRQVLDSLVRTVAFSPTTLFSLEHPSLLRL